MPPQSPLDSAVAQNHATSGSTRGFWSLIVTQFQGAFSDNVLKNLVVFMIIGGSLSLADEHKIGEQVGALFSLPFILFSMAGGYLADRLSKRTVMIGVKVFEVFVMIFVLIGFMTRQLWILECGIFLMGTHSAFFGPSKYSSLPELLPEKRLSWGNGILELGTFMAIILGTVLAGWLSQKLGQRQAAAGGILIGLAFAGLLASLGITKVPAANPGKKFRVNFVADLIDRLKPIRKDRPLVLALAGNVYFMFLGALLLLNLFFYGDRVLRVSKIEIGYLNVALAMGIGLGSVAAGYLSGGKIEYGLVPLGGVGMAIACASLASPHVSFAGALVRLGLLGFAGGFFIVPISALLQHRPPKDKKGEVLAAANLLSFVGAFLASAAHYLLAQVAQLSPPQIFLFGGIATFIGGTYATWLLPDSLLRFILWVVTHTIYRIRVLGRDHIPEHGGALFICNHLSHVDALLLMSSTDRHIKFLMHKSIYEKTSMKPFARILGVIPIASEQRPREMIQSLREASEAIKDGHVVCIFPEGQITRIGFMLPFQRGFERIMKDIDAPIIPIALDGVWGSIFSFEKGRFLWKFPRQVPYPVTVNFGKPLPPTATPFEVRQEVQELMVEAWRERKPRMKPLHREFVHTARLHPFRFAMADGLTSRVNFGAALIKTIFLARRLRRLEALNGLNRLNELNRNDEPSQSTNPEGIPPQSPRLAGNNPEGVAANGKHRQMVGLLLPPSVGGALANFAVMLMGKVPVNLNYTVSEETLTSCIRQCEIQTVISSRAFLEKVKLKLPVQTVFLEDLSAKPGLAEKIAAFLSALLPISWLEKSVGGESADLDDLATVIFSSGSTGDPKGVMLSHYNIGSNIAQLEQVFGLTPKDRVLGVLPFFHSFGFTGTLFLPAVVGVGAIYHSNPLDAKTIGSMVKEYRITFLLATPTFLQLYMRGCPAEDFGSLRLIMTGAEKLPERLAAAFEEKFGIRPLEGYGCTECGPAVAVNTDDFRSAGFRQVGGKRGKIGHPLPGVSVHIVDPQTNAPVQSGQPGLMLVSGPNIMQGYLGRPEKTAEVLKDGWYVTGDIAAVDDDGFLQITDRLSRFSKIGGEMVPHIKVEEKLHELAGVTEQTFVVAGVPDEKKGERLVVLHKMADGQLQSCLEKLAQSDLPNLWKPRPDQFFKIEALPYLGTGKIDLRKVKEMAAAFAKSQG
jgi:acyl-[acyl-carrier-protein]-phospholipid O-acyltransferase/long-chain-fatty-acid--[acyl-carrier-protein] ligase